GRCAPRPAGRRARAARRAGRGGCRRARDRGPGRVGLRPRTRRARGGGGAAPTDGPPPPRAGRAVPPGRERRAVTTTTERTGSRAPDQGAVYDIGYRSYSGPREGRHRARLAVFKNGVRTALGLGRGARAKALSWLFITILAGLALIMA